MHPGADVRCRDESKTIPRLRIEAAIVWSLLAEYLELKGKWAANGRREVAFYSVVNKFAIRFGLVENCNPSGTPSAPTRTTRRSHKGGKHTTARGTVA